MARQENRLTLDRRNTLSRFHCRPLRPRHGTARIPPRAEEHRVQWLSVTGRPLYVDTFEAGHPSRLDAAWNRADIAASMQRALENYVLNLVGDAENVCLAGGVAWNALLIAALNPAVKVSSPSRRRGTRGPRWARPFSPGTKTSIPEPVSTAVATTSARPIQPPK